MRSSVLGGLSLLVGLCLVLGSCLNSDEIANPYQQLLEDVRKIDTYLANNPPNPGDIIIRDASGIRLVITQMGTGIIPPTPENIIQVAYTGRLLSNGSQFDTDDSYTFTLTTRDAGGSDVIVGWKHALYMMTVGTRATVYIPSGLAYGSSGKGTIPGNAVLVFDLELKTVNTDNEEPQLTSDIAKISAYIEENEIANVQEDLSGLRYLIEDAGTGDAPGLYDHIRMRYTGKIMNEDETVFSDNVEEGPTSLFSSRVINYIHGITIGLQKMHVGGRATFYIPSALAYGPTARDVIPPNSTLIFDVELLEVIPNGQ